jgi:uncharacterized protein YjbJ (UPF0337 family)
MGAIANKIKGKLKKVEGRVTGDKLREAQGKVQETAGDIGTKAKLGAAKVKAKAKAAKATLSTKVGRKAAAAKITP